MANFSLFDIGRNALIASRAALDTTAHNVANASTPGYTRQEVVLENIPSGVIISRSQSGRGVRVKDVRRMYDTFVSLQLRNEKSNLSYWEVYNRGVARIEDLFNESSGTGIATATMDFFNAWQEVSQSPEGSAQRIVLVERARYLAGRLQDAFSSLNDEKREVLKESEIRVSEVNEITTKIAELNQKIIASPGALDLLDQRDALIERLNEIAKVRTFENESGAYTVLLGGAVLVEETQKYDLTVSTDTADRMRYVLDPGGNSRDVTDFVTGGELKAELDIRETLLPSMKDRLNAFIVNLSGGVNRLHRQGFGLDGSTGLDFFAPLATTVDPAGGGTISSVMVNAPGSFDYNRYRIDYTFSPPEDVSDFVVTDLTTGATVSAVQTPGPGGLSRKLAFNGIEVTVEGLLSADESFEVQVNRNAAQDVQVMIGDPSQVAASADAFILDGSNNTILFDDGAVRSATLAPGTYGGEEIAIELKRALEEANGTADTYTVLYNPTLKLFEVMSDAGNSSPIDILWENGGTTAGGIFGFSGDHPPINPGGASVSDIQVGALVGKGPPGDNRNARALASLSESPMMGGRSPIDFFRDIVAEVGVESRSADQMVKFQDSVVEELEMRRQEVSGVNLDEEAAKLIKYQKMFGAAAKMIQLADEMLQTLVDMVGR